MRYSLVVRGTLSTIAQTHAERNSSHCRHPQSGAPKDQLICHSVIICQMSVCAIFIDCHCASFIDQRSYLVLKNPQLLNLVFDRPHKDSLNTGGFVHREFFPRRPPASWREATRGADRRADLAAPRAFQTKPARSQRLVFDDVREHGCQRIREACRIFAENFEPLPQFC